MNKKELRQRIREAKRQLSENQLIEMSEQVCNILLSHPAVKQAKTILLYWSLPDEVCTHELVQQLAAQGKHILLPKVISETEMTLHSFTSLSDLSMGAFDIYEPTTPALSLSSLTDKPLLAIIPGMAFDHQKHRVGRGKGYYDRLLQQLSHAYRIGICFQFQYINDVIPTNEYDVAMNEIITTS